jgi:hypothetical protein
MAGNGKKENILTSWKEIAAYLDRDVRTCVRWEQRYGLPVRRLERDSKAKVFAYKDQIDAWLAERSAGGKARSGGKGLAGRLLRPLPILFALAGLAAAAYFLFFRGPSSASPSVPADFHIHGSNLIIVDQAGRELGTFDTRVHNLVSEEEYRTHFKDIIQSGDYVTGWPYIKIIDLDGDSRPEVLFSVQTKSDIGEGTVICLDDHGQERWRRETGREFVIGGQTFRGEYRIFGFNVEDYDGDGALEVLVISHHRPDWPCQTVLIDATGLLEGEYWNAGYFMDARAGDLDGDGDKELVLSGVNNEYSRGCVAIFEAGGLRGGSPQDQKAYRWTDLAAGGQSAYILFPTSDVAAAMHLRGDPINYIAGIYKGEGLTVYATGAQIYYDLDRALNCQKVTLSNTFKNHHDEFIREGKVWSDLNDDYLKNLKDSILYFGDGAFVTRSPALAKKTERPDKAVEGKR